MYSLVKHLQIQHFTQRQHFTTLKKKISLFHSAHFLQHATLNRIPDTNTIKCVSLFFNKIENSDNACMIGQFSLGILYIIAYYLLDYTQLL